MNLGLRAAFLTFCLDKVFADVLISVEAQNCSCRCVPAKDLAVVQQIFWATDVSEGVEREFELLAWGRSIILHMYYLFDRSLLSATASRCDANVSNAL